MKKNQLISVLLLATLFMMSCGASDQQEEVKDGANSDIVSEQQDEVEFKFLANATISKTVKDVTYEGLMFHTLAWKDKNGENLALFTKTEDQLWVYHYTFPNGVAKLMRKVQDNVFDCPLDLSLNFKKESFGVTDLDNDNIGELSFVYNKGCRGDVSPLDMRMLLLENGDKYIIRGTEAMDLAGYEVESTKTISSEFKNGPKAFLDHANALWRKHEMGSFN